MTRTAVAAWTQAWQTGLVSLSELEAAAVTTLAQHRLMTTRQLHTLLCPAASLRWMQVALQRLAAAGLVDRKVARDRASVWFVTPAGNQLAAESVPARVYEITPQKAGGPLQQHTLDANAVGVAFAQHARDAGHDCGPLDWDNEVAHRIADGGDKFANLLVSDLRVRCWVTAPTGDRGLVCLVELDRCTCSLIDLHQKVRGYSQLITYIPAAGKGVQPTRRYGWQQHYTDFPKLVFVFAGRDEPALERRIDGLASLVLADPDLADQLGVLDLYLTTLRRITTSGPFAPIFEKPDRAADDLVDILDRPARR